MREFPEGFLFGAATSSHQVEGGNVHNDWWDWEQAGKIEDGTTSGDAAGWWAGRAEEDLAKAAELGHRAHRMSLEWSRLEPEVGRFDGDAFERYREILRFAASRDLTILCTLNHFTLPRWIAKMGGWTHPNVPALFEGFATRAADALGPHVALWATLNEPSVLAYMGYAGTRWPPGRGSMRACFTAMRHMLDAHALGYRALHRTLPQPRVGIVLNMPRFAPAAPSRALDRWAAAAQDWAFNGAALHALAEGRYAFPLSALPRPAPLLRRSFDWVGLNFYGRYDVRFDPSAVGEAFGRHVQTPTVRTEHNDWGQPDPGAMVAQLERLSALGVPLYVTENGTCDETQRTDYLRSHLEAIADAAHEGLDVRGYFAWSLVDNFEWAEGWSTRFGHLALDRETQARTERETARAYAEVIARGARAD